MTNHGCRFNLRYCPPEIAAVFCPSRENTYDLTTAAEVFNFGLVLAEVAGATRLHPITDEQEYRRRLTCMSYDSWVQVSGCLWIHQPLQ